MTQRQLVAVLGATGTAGRRVVQALRDAQVEVVGINRSMGVDLVDGTGLDDAFVGVTAVVDASSMTSPPTGVSILDATQRATSNIVGAARRAGVRHVVVLSIVGIDAPCFGPGSYYESKRAQEAIYIESGIPTTVVRTTQWFEFAVNRSAVTFADDRVEVQDRLMQPVAASAVASYLADVARRPPPEPGPAVLHELCGPDQMLLSELTAAVLHHVGDPRPVVALPPAIPELMTGVLVPGTDTAQVLAPTLATWLEGIHILSDVLP